MSGEDVKYYDLCAILQYPEPLRFMYKYPAFAFLKLNMYGQSNVFLCLTAVIIIFSSALVYETVL